MMRRRETPAAVVGDVSTFGPPWRPNA